MRQGFTRAMNNDPKAVAAYHAAFGQNADHQEVGRVIGNLETKNLPVDPSTKKFPHDQRDALAAVPATPIDTGMGIGVFKEPAQFSAGFHGKLHVRIKSLHT